MDSPIISLSNHANIAYVGSLNRFSCASFLYLYLYFSFWVSCAPLYVWFAYISNSNKKIETGTNNMVADFPAVFFKLCHGTKIWKSVQKKRTINYLLSGADWRNRPGWQWLHKFQRVCLAHDQVCICLCLYLFVIV